MFYYTLFFSNENLLKNTRNNVSQRPWLTTRNRCRPYQWVSTFLMWPPLNWIFHFFVTPYNPYGVPICFFFMKSFKYTLRNVIENVWYIQWTSFLMDSTVNWRKFVKKKYVFFHSSSHFCRTEYVKIITLNMYINNKKKNNYNMYTS